jgi:hypothetical protein
MTTAARYRRAYADRLLTEVVHLADASGTVLAAVRGIVVARQPALTDDTTRQATGRYQVVLELNTSGQVIDTNAVPVTVNETMRVVAQGRTYRLLPPAPTTALSLGYVCDAEEDGGL